MSYERRQQFYRAYDAEKKNGILQATTLPHTSTNASVASQISTASHTAPPGVLGEFGPSYEINLACLNDRPVDVFKLLSHHPDQGTKKTYFRINSVVLDNFRKLKGRTSVFACHRLIHKVASTSAYNYDKNTAVHSPIDSPENNVGAFSVLKRLDLCIIRAHQQYKDTFHYFAHCLFSCHKGKSDFFLTHHTNWSIVTKPENQIGLCVCTSDECVKK
jgi:hypothetical protein